MDCTLHRNRGIKSLLHLIIILISLMSFSYYRIIELYPSQCVAIHDVQSDMGGESKEGNIGSENHELSDKYIDQFIDCLNNFSADKTENCVCQSISLYDNILDKPENPPKA